jgi:hypothetical protein
MVTKSESSPTILRLTPAQVAKTLEKFIANGTVKKDTLFVWDIDNTLILPGSDYSSFGVKPTCSRFSKIIRGMQRKGVVHIALTNASPFNNELKIERGVLKLTSVPQIASIYPHYILKTGNTNRPLTFERLRIEGLKHIGINFINSEWKKLPRELEIIQFHHDTKQDPDEKELSKIVSRSGKILEVWTDAKDQKVYRHIQCDAIVPDFEPNDRKRHFIQSDSNLSEVLCRPIFPVALFFAILSIFTPNATTDTLRGIFCDHFWSNMRNEPAENFPMSSLSMTLWPALKM